MSKIKWEDRIDDGKGAPGPNLVVLYSFLALAMLGAIGFAVAIIYPFYLRR
jgi:hypothetical protein